MNKLVKKDNWNPYLPISALPKEIRGYFTEHAKILYEELNYNKLEVVLVPAPEPYTERNKIRAVLNRPPGWYSEMYFILGQNRERTLQALERIINSRDGKPKDEHPKRWYKRDVIIRDMIFEHLTKGFEDNYYSARPIKKVIRYFKV